ncbi:hypothetical protein KFL_000650280 [Klebsormidium nitens]|uniref:Uncharacterized protein n=1 Tax=Klebsormidium nitens TaxID=105231 RepID=A0A1Y1HQI7_KLENI|nr:hypothetical protein KFL_000650280 [Klebsormidium nitens]|eukprot:GAQ80895.1 hypothetical protein KFL_000650280 [Klebsormidium nitens]
MDDGDVEAVEFEGGLTAAFLRTVTGAEDLSTVSCLELSVNAAEACLFDVGQLVPQLRELKLLDSTLPQIRDLGTGLMQLQVLWVPRCGLQEVDGLSSLPKLRELYAAFNDIEDLAPIAGLENLEILDLEANKVADLDGVAFLGMCPKLQALTLEGNDVAAAPNYRSSVVELIPTLTMLDELPVGPSDRDAAAAGGQVPGQTPVVEAAPETPRSADELRELVLVRDGIKYARVAAAPDETLRQPVCGERASSAPSTSGRPASAAARMRHSYSAGLPRPWTPSSGVRPMSAFGSRPSTAAGGRPGTAAGTRPGTARQRPASFQRVSEEGSSSDHASELTFGTDQVFCGNPVQALRRRKASGGQAAHGVSASPRDSSGEYSPTTVAGLAPGSGAVGDDHRELLQELAEVKAKSAEEGDALLESRRGEEEAQRADVLVVEHAAPPNKTRGEGRTKSQLPTRGEQGKVGGPRSRMSSGSEEDTRPVRGQTSSQRTPLLVSKSSGNGGKADANKPAQAARSRAQARSPEPVSVGRLRPRDRLSAQTCVVGS